MDKKEALKRLSSLEEETKELRKIIEAPDPVKDIKEMVKSFEDACIVIGEDPTGQKFLIGTKDDIAYQKLKVIIKALNEGWIPDWSNTSQYKYTVYFIHKTGFGLSCYGYDAWCTGTFIGSRLCFKSRELAEYAGKQFETIYRDYFTY